jgi:hypothetical protein
MAHCDMLQAQAELELEAAREAFAVNLEISRRLAEREEYAGAVAKLPSVGASCEKNRLAEEEGRVYTKHKGNYSGWRHLGEEIGQFIDAGEAGIGLFGRFAEVLAFRRPSGNLAWPPGRAG